MPSTLVARFGVGFLSAAFLCGIGVAGPLSSSRALAVRGDMLRPAQILPRSDVVSYALSRAEGRKQLVMRLADGQEAFRHDEERALTIIVRSVEVPPVPDAAPPKATWSSATSVTPRRGNPVGCERALSGLVRASALSATRCLT